MASYDEPGVSRAHSTSKAIELETQYGSKNYSPTPVVISRGLGTEVWDPEGKRYLDFLSGYSVVNQGHCHPKIVAALIEQAQRLTQISRAFYSDVFGTYAAYATRKLGYDRLLAVNSGVEAVETAIKLSRKWGYEIKGIPENEAKIVFCADNFHGRTLAAVSASTSPDSRKSFGPYQPGFITIPFGDIDSLAAVVQDSTIAAFIVEPIQGEAGVVVPPQGYLKQAAELCKNSKVLFVADEIQTGLARTGRILACDHEDVKPDILILGKALSGGMMPVSAVLADDAVMLCFKPGDHGSTFGGNPLACAVGMAALEVIFDERLAENADRMGAIFRSELEALGHPRISQVRGKGLLNALVIETRDNQPTGADLCVTLKEYGLLAKLTRPGIIRFAPPLVITEAQMRDGLGMIRAALEKF